ncbi:hypothetical protein ACFVFS_28170 [Kitasatospora sp. NPDC057692]|uniref:hypothetical protein n=1 Tax=Kitasatospora sp. NPDC057692 TaxID=3346215 RepID=UPI0036979902
MTEPESTAPDARDQETVEDREVANELRVLLQLAAPHLPTPEDRMERVLARVIRTRRRRRRAALAGGLGIGLTAAVLAAAPALAPGPPGTALGPAASGPAVTASPSASPSAVPDDGSADTTTVTFPLLDDLAVDVPDSWYSLTAQPGAEQPDPTVYLASQQISGAAGCPIRDGRQDPVCISSGMLLDDGVLITLRLIRDQAAVTKFQGEAEPTATPQATKECSLRGGVEQLTRHRPLVLDGRLELVQLTACMRRPSSETLKAVAWTLTSLRPAGTAPDRAAAPALPSPWAIRSVPAVGAK